MRSVDKNIFLAFLKCPKLAVYMSKYTQHSENTFDEKPNMMEVHFKEFAYNRICKMETDEGTKVVRDKVYKTEGGVEVTCDIIIKRKEENILVETVCSNDLKDGPELMWLAYKYYMLKLTTANIKTVYIVKIDPKYIEGASPKDEILFTIDVTKKLKHHLYKIPKCIRDFNAMQECDELPDVHKGVRCLEPDVCPFKKHCWQDMPLTEETIFEIQDMDAYTKFLHYWNENYKFEDIPKKDLDFRQGVQVRYALKNQETNPKRIKMDKISPWLNDLHLENKVHFLYIGCLYPAIPMIKGAKPFSKIPFQFSLDTKYPDTSNYNHYDFVADVSNSLCIDKQFLNHFLERLSFLETDTSIVVYDIERAKKCFKKLIEWNPEQKNRIDSVIKRLKDLKEVFYNCWYYQPNFKGSYKLLEIAPKFLPDFSFMNLPISESEGAGNMFLESYYKKSKHYHNHTEVLRKYSRLNTFCLMEVVKFLLNLAKS